MKYNSFCVPKSLKTYEYNILEIYDWSVPGNLSDYFEAILLLASEFADIPMNIAEFGVHKGRATLATSLFLKQLGKPARIHAYDTWEGFPESSIHPLDGDDGWHYLLQSGSIDKSFIEQKVYVEKLYALRKQKLVDELDVSNISTSGNFSDTSLQQLKTKAKFLGISDIIYHKGDFSHTLQDPCALPSSPLHIVLMDCDLFLGYSSVLPKIWPLLAVGGIVYLDEYFSYKFPGARIATDKFLETLLPDSYDLKRISFNGEFERFILEKK
jgi:hypothetical protein